MWKQKQEHLGRNGKQLGGKNRLFRAIPGPQKLFAGAQFKRHVFVDCRRRDEKQTTFFFCSEGKKMEEKKRRDLLIGRRDRVGVALGVDGGVGARHVVAARRGGMRRSRSRSGCGWRRGGWCGGRVAGLRRRVALYRGGGSV